MSRYSFIAASSDSTGANWENALRGGAIEFWSLSCALADGGYINACFSNCRRPDICALPNPTVSVDFSLPDGNHEYRRYCGGLGRVINASREYCDVNIGGSYLRMEDSRNYSFYFVDDKIEISAQIIPQMPIWSPGQLNNGEGRSLELLFAVPDSLVSVSIRRGQTFTTADGRATLLHCWGNLLPGKAADHIYICSAFAQGISAIGLDMTGRNAADDFHVSGLYVASNGEVLSSNIFDHSAVKDGIALNERNLISARTLSFGSCGGESCACGAAFNAGILLSMDYGIPALTRLKRFILPALSSAEFSADATVSLPDGEAQLRGTVRCLAWSAPDRSGAAALDNGSNIG